jgi:hypothetical protein
MLRERATNVMLYTYFLSCSSRYSLRLGLPTGLFPLCFRTETLYSFHYFPIPAAHPTLFIFRDPICYNDKRQVVRIMSFLILQSLQPPVMSSLLRPSGLSTLFSNFLRDIPHWERPSFTHTHTHTHTHLQTRASKHAHTKTTANFKY